MKWGALLVSFSQNNTPLEYLAAKVDPKVVCIQNYGASGSIPLASFLDSHPEIVTTPALTNLGLIALYKNLPKTNFNEFLASFLEKKAIWFGETDKIDWGLDRLGESHNEKIFISKDKFQNNFSQILGFKVPHLRDFFLAVHFAYSLSIGQIIPLNPVIVYPIHAADKEEVKSLIHAFSDVRFIYSVREPVENLQSLLKYFRNLHPKVNAFAAAIAMVFCERELHLTDSKTGRQLYGLRPYLKSLHCVSRAFLFENMHTRLRENMEAIGNWLGIKWDNVLLKSSFDGKKYWNRPMTVFVSGASQEILSVLRENNNLEHPQSFFDVFRLKLLAINIRRKFHYSQYWWENKLFYSILPFLFVFPFSFERQASQRILYRIEKMDQSGFFLRFFPSGFALFIIAWDYFLVRYWLMFAWLRGIFVKSTDLIDPYPI